MRKKDIANFESIHKIIQDLPPDLIFVIRATNLISSHNIILGGTQRDRFMIYTQYCLRLIERTEIGYWWAVIGVGLRLWVFENFWGVFRVLFGGL